MAKYDRSGPDPYTDPRTGILRNTVGATDQAPLDAREVEFTTARTFELTLRPEPRGFDLAHLRRIHARLFGDVNVLHPFREGNGRVQRVLFGQLAREAGYRLAWKGMIREVLVEASIEAMCGEHRPMTALLRAHLSASIEPNRAPRVRPAEAVGVYSGPVAAVTRETVTQVVAGEHVEHARSRLTGRLGSLAPG